MTEIRGLAKDVLEDLFDGIGSAKSAQDSNYPKGGHYFERIEKIETAKNRHKEPIWICGTTVLHVLSDGTSCPYSGSAEHSVGEEVGQVIKMTSNEYFLSDIKLMLKSLVSEVAEAYETLTEQEWKDICLEMCGESQPFAGMFVEVANREILKKGKSPEDENNHFTQVRYKREIPASEILKTVPEAVINRLIGMAALESLIEAENE